MIPFIMHNVFLSKTTHKHAERAIPYIWKRYKKTFKNIHRHWQHMLWTYDNAMPFIKAQYPKWQRFFCDIPVPVVQADILRYMVLSHFGGWYFDLDCEAIRPVDTLCNNEVALPLERSVAFGDAYNQIGNTVLASKPHHPLWDAVLANILEHKNEILAIADHNKERIIALTGPTLVQRTFDALDTTAQKRCNVLKREHFHMPMSHPLTHTEYKTLRKNRDVFALHHSDSTWRNTDTRALFRRKIIARIAFLHTLSKAWAYLKQRLARKNKP